PDDADAFTAAYEELEPFEQRAPPARGREGLCVEDDVARAGRRHEAERDALRGGPHVLGALEPVELLEHLAPALRLLRLLAGDVLADEVFRLGDQALLALDQRSLAREVTLPRHDVVRIAQRVDAKGPATELHGRPARVVEERSVVTDDEHGAPVV